MKPAGPGVVGATPGVMDHHNILLNVKITLNGGINMFSEFYITA